MSARHPALAAPLLAQHGMAQALPVALPHAVQALPRATPMDPRPGVGDAADSSATAPRARQGRERILAAIRQAAIAEFSRHGFKGTSTLAIAERAGLTKPQLHYYISSKEDLYEELLYSVLDGWSQAFSFGTTSDLDEPAQVLAHYVRKKLDYALDQPELSRIFTNEVLSGGQHLGRYWPLAVQSTQHKVDLINHWIAQGRMLPMDGHVLLMQIWGMTQHFADYAVQVSVMLGLAPNERVDREALAQQLTNFVLRGCGLAPK